MQRNFISHCHIRIQCSHATSSPEMEEKLGRIVIVVQARKKKYDESPTLSITVDVPKRNFADNFAIVPYY